jgi:hypothetical protein
MKKLWVVPWQQNRGRHITKCKYNFKVLDDNI